uniref:Uncharacterized protein n=1 Tax=Arundo donax TaxID=35708 RepID=A0A0A8Z2X3_ARUDO
MLILQLHGALTTPVT